MRGISLGLLGAVFAGALSAQIPSVPADGVVNAASFAQRTAVAPGSIVAIFGTNLTSTLATAGSIPLSANLANVTVAFNGIATPLFGVFPGSLSQINAQIPWDVLPQGTSQGSVSLVVTNNGVQSSSTPILITQNEPGIFTLNAQGFGQAAVTTVDGSAFIGPVGAIAGVTSRPAHIGDFVVIYATGLGPVDHPPSNGDIPRNGLANTLTTPTVLIGGVPGNVSFSGLNPFFVGLYQVNVQIQPGTPTGDAVSIQIQMNGFTSTDRATIAVTQ